MQTEVKEIGPCKLSIKIKIPPEKVKEKLDEKYQHFLESASVPGFRKGKAPRGFLERKYGKEVNEEVKLDLINSSYEDVLKEKKLNPIAEPDIDHKKIPFDQNKALDFEVTVEVSPEIKLEKYKGIEIKKVVPKVTDAEVNKALEGLRQSRGEVIVQKEPAREGDIVIADQETKMGDQMVGKQENSPLKLTSELRLFNKPAPELVKALTGAKAGDVKEIKVTIPKEHEKPEFRNKPAVLKVSVKEVKSIKLPEVNDAWAKQLNLTDLKHLKEELKKGIMRDKEKEAERAMENDIMEKILKETDFPLPESLVTKGVDYLAQRRRLELHQGGMAEDKIREELEKAKKDSKAQTEKDLKIHFIMEHIIKEEKVYVTENEITERINQIATQYRKWPQEIKTYYERHNLMGQLRNEIKEEKVRKLLREKAKITD